MYFKKNVCLLTNLFNIAFYDVYFSHFIFVQKSAIQFTKHSNTTFTTYNTLKL